MEITFHLEVGQPEKYVWFPHSMLSSDVQEEIIKVNRKQDCYKVNSRDFYILIYFEDDSRLDILW